MSAHPYESWELFGKFVCKYRELCKDGEIGEFVRVWSLGRWDVINKDWPEFGKFFEKETGERHDTED